MSGKDTFFSFFALRVRIERQREKKRVEFKGWFYVWVLFFLALAWRATLYTSLGLCRPAINKWSVETHVWSCKSPHSKKSSASTFSSPVHSYELKWGSVSAPPIQLSWKCTFLAIKAIAHLLALISSFSLAFGTIGHSSLLATISPWTVMTLFSLALLSIYSSQSSLLLL